MTVGGEDHGERYDAASYAQLYVKDPTDCIVIYGLCNKLTVREVNDLLYKYERPLL